MGKQKPKTSIIAQMSAKAMDSLYARISNLLDSYYLKIIVSEPNNRNNSGAEWRGIQHLLHLLDSYYLKIIVSKPNKRNDVETESRLDCRKQL